MLKKTVRRRFFLLDATCSTSRSCTQPFQRWNMSNLRADRLVAVVPRPPRGARANSWQGAVAVVLARDGALGLRAVVARPSLLWG